MKHDMEHKYMLSAFVSVLHIVAEKIKKIKRRKKTRMGIPKIETDHVCVLHEIIATLPI